MTVNEALAAFAAYEKTSFSLSHASGLIYYDGATAAPKGSAQVRGRTLGELSRLSYELTTSPQTVEMIETLYAERGSLDAITARKISELKRDYDRMHRIPVEEYVAYTELCSESSDVWHTAKENNDFASFEPYLQKVFDMTRRIACWQEPDRDPYDTMLDSFERGLDRGTCDRFFGVLREKLPPLIDAVTSHADRVDDSPLHANFPVSIQREFSDFVMGLMEIDREHCIIGETEHPFTTNFSKYDVRITTHYHEDAVASSLYSVIHEGGHALYELHTGDALAFSALGTGVSMAIHESQSRFYENIIGRSRAFCSLLYPWLRDRFPAQLSAVSEDGFFRMINRAEPSLIRTEADELTYCMHIMIRYELERAMFAGDLTAHELPSEWNRLYREYLSVTVPDDRRGVLQDSHWSDGAIGYFPSYAIGSAYGAQFLREMNREFDVFSEVANGGIGRVNAWLEDKIWRHGCMIDPTDLFRSVCGTFDPQVYIDYLTEKFTDVYRL